MRLPHSYSIHHRYRGGLTITYTTIEQQQLFITESTPDSVNEEIPNKKQISIELHQLDLLTDNEKTVKIIDSVAHTWEKLALRLHFDGSDIARIKRDNTNDCIQACRTVFTEWLQGKGRRPGTWETLVEALREAGFIELANEVKTIVLC